MKMSMNKLQKVKIIVMLSTHFSVSEIAEILGISRNTVMKYQRNNILEY